MLEQEGVGEDVFSEYGTCASVVLIFIIGTGPWLAKMTSDANAGALDSGLDTALVYIDKAPVAFVRQYTDKLCSNAIDKAFGARPATLAKFGSNSSALAIITHCRGKALILKMMEVDEPTACSTQLLGKLGDKKVTPPL